jgi:hypothetical protein
MSMEAVMPMLKILAEAIGMMFGSLLGAAALAYLAWWISSHIHYPRVAWIMLILAAGGLCFSSLGQSEFVKMMAIFAGIASGILYIAARDEIPEQSPKSTRTNRRAVGERP